jgi:hypothetical protein
MSIQPGKNAASFIDALRGMPLVLAVVGVTLGLVGLLYYQASLLNSQRTENMKFLTEMQKLLSVCVVPAR